MDRVRLLPHLASLTIPEIWHRIDAWLADEHPELADVLAPPSPPSEIAELERALGVALPEDYRASLAVHAGNRQRLRRDGRPYTDPLFVGFNLLTPDVVLERWRFLEQYARFPTSEYAAIDGTRRAYYDRGWIPVVAADEDLAVFYCIDTVPPEPSRQHQIVTMVTNDPDRDAPWASFRELLISELLTPIDQGYAVDPDLLEEDQLIELVADDDEDDEDDEDE